MERESRVVTLPNVISLVRLACAPIFVWLLVDDQNIAAATLLAVLGASDWIDGWIARHFDQGSELGKVLDPVADRILLITAGVALVIDGSVPLIVGVLVLVREAIVSVAVLVLAAVGARRIDVQWSGKAGTLAIMFAFPLFLLADSTSGSASDIFLALAWFFTVSGLVFGYYAAITYVPIARRALREGRGGREGREGRDAASTAHAGSVTR
jgi:cardiolipin synthase